MVYNGSKILEYFKNLKGEKAKMTKFTFQRKDKRTNLEKEIDSILICMADSEVGSEEYNRGLEIIERLSKLKEYDKKEDTRKRIDPNVILQVLGSIACVLLIASFEQDGIFPTKCFPFIPKGRA